jgi:hypothetical protein
MRADLETAMGVALTSRGACALLVEDPDEYAQVFGLDERESLAISAMARDLAALMPSFVIKREQVLRRALRLTLRLLHDRELVDLLVEEFSDTHPAAEKMTSDMLAFAEFLEVEIGARAVSLAYAAVLVDMARFEHLRLRCFSTPTPLQPVLAGETASSRGLDPTRPLHVHPTAAWDRFGWDLRSVRRREDLGRLRADECTLLYVQRGLSGELSTLRIGDDALEVLELVSRHPDQLSLEDLCLALTVQRSVGATTGKLVRQGVLECGL